MASNTTVTIQSIVEKERSHFQISTQVLTSGNIDAYETAFGLFTTALDAIILGVIRQEVIKFKDQRVSSLLPASNLARRELKLLVRYIGATSGDKFTLEIACPDLASLTMETGDANFVNILDAGVMAAFVTEAEVIMRSPNDAGEVITIDSVQVVGRNI